MLVHREFVTPEEHHALRYEGDRLRPTARPVLHGYHYANARVLPLGLEPLYRRCREIMAGVVPVFYDCFFMYYTTGAGNRPHVDQDRAMRVIVLVEKPAVGGELIINGDPVELYERDAVVFSPARDEHSVAPLTGRRVIWSVGARMDRDEWGRAR